MAPPLRLPRQRFPNDLRQLEPLAFERVGYIAHQPRSLGERCRSSAPIARSFYLNVIFNTRWSWLATIRDSTWVSTFTTTKRRLESVPPRCPSTTADSASTAGSSSRSLPAARQTPAPHYTGRARSDRRLSHSPRHGIVVALARMSVGLKLPRYLPVSFLG